MRAVEFQILAGIQHVKPTDPRTDGNGQQPRLPTGPAANRQPATHRRHRHGEAEKELRVGGVAFGQRIPEHDTQRHGRQRQTDGVQHRRRTNKHHRRDKDEARRFEDAQHTARDFTRRGARIEGVEPRVHQPVEPHRRTASGDHRHENPGDPAPRDRMGARREQRASQRKGQGKHRMAEANERQIDGQAFEHGRWRIN